MTELNLIVPEKVTWQQRNQRSVAEIARELIRQHLDGIDYNTPSVFVRYRLDRNSLGLWDRIRRRDPLFEDWVFQGESHGSIKVLSQRSSSSMNLSDYLNNSVYAHLSYQIGSHHGGNCVLEANSGSTRIGIIEFLE